MTGSQAHRPFFGQIRITISASQIKSLQHKAWPVTTFQATPVVGIPIPISCRLVQGTICYSALPRGAISSVIFPLTTRPLPLSFTPYRPLPRPPPRPPCFP